MGVTSDGYKKNPNDKIYKMINKKDIESYEKTYAEVEVFIKQFPHLKNIVVNGLKKTIINSYLKVEMIVLRTYNQKCKQLRKIIMRLKKNMKS